jgi:hypothetical protein
MTIERALRLIAGLFVTLSVVLALTVDSRFLWFTLFVGLNLVPDDHDARMGGAAARVGPWRRNGGQGIVVRSARRIAWKKRDTVCA